MRNVFDHREAMQEITIFLVTYHILMMQCSVHPLVKCDDEKMSKFLFSIALISQHYHSSIFQPSSKLNVRQTYLVEFNW